MTNSEFQNRSLAATFIEILKGNIAGSKQVVFINSVQQESTLSYKDLYYTAAHLAEGLLRNGLHFGDEAIFQIKDPKSFIIAFWACLFAGVIPIPLSIPETEDSRIKLLKILKKLSSPKLVYDELDVSKLDQTDIENQLHVDISKFTSININHIDETLVKTEGKLVNTHFFSPSPTAFVQFSSGSSGDPKGVLLSHRNLICNTSDIFRKSSMTKESRQLSWLPLTHDMGLIGFHLTGVFGNLDQFIVPTNLFIKKPLIWLDKISAHRITHTYSPNFGFRYLLNSIPLNQSKDWNLSSVEVMYNGAESVSDEICNDFESALKKYGLRENVIFPAYGLAEASVAVTIHNGGPRISLRLDREFMCVGNKIRYSSSNGMTVVSTGEPINSCRVRIVDERNQILPEEHIGDIQIQGPNVTSGYYNEPLGSQSLFTHDRWLKTGDLGFLKKNQLFVTGRRKNLIIINGENYYPEDIERFLTQIPGVQLGKIAVISAQIAGEERVVLFYSARIADKDRETFINEIKKRFFEETQLNVFDLIFIKSIPKTTSGKIQHFKLKEYYLKYKRSEYVNRVTPAHISIRKTIREILERYLFHTLHEDDDFFQCGLNSMAALKIVFDINRTLNKSIVVSDVFSNQTLNKLEAFLDRDFQNQSIVPRRSENSSLHESSFGQKRLWVLSKLNEVLDFNLCVLFSVKGLTDFTALNVAWSEIIDRHEILRTYLIEEEGILMQKVHPNASTLSIIHELDYSQSHDGENLAKEFASGLLKTPISITDQDLLKLFIIKISDDFYITILSCHHVLIDGWSLTILRKELLTLLSKDSHRFDHTDTLTFQYKDYARWYNKQVDANVYRLEADFWSEKYKDGFPKFTFPILQGQVPQSQKPIGKTVDYKLLQESTLELREQTQQAGTTLFVGLAAVLSISLSRYSLNKEVFFGTPTTGRISPDLHNQVGYYINVLPLRFSVNESLSFSDILSDFKREWIELYQNQNYPIDKIVELNRNNDNSLSSFFEVLILYQNFDSTADKSKFVDLIVDVSELTSDSVISNLYFEFIEYGKDIHLKLKYNSSLYSHQQIEELLFNIDLLLKNCTRHFDRPIRQFNTSLTGQNLLQREFDALRPVNTLSTVFDLFMHHVHTYPDRVAVISGKTQLSYAQVNDRVEILAKYLSKKYQITPHCLILLCLARTELMIVSVLATWKLRAVFIPIDSLTPVERVEDLISDSGVSLVICDERSNYRFPTQVLQLGTQDQFLESDHGSEITFQRNEPDDPAYVIYTSGSTGKPKAVMVKHNALASVTMAWVDCYQLDRFIPRVLQIASFGFDVFIGDLCRAVCNGGCLVISPFEIQSTPEELYKVLISNDINMFESTPSIVLPLLDYIIVNKCDFHLLRIVIVGSEGWLYSDYKRLCVSLPEGLRLINSYGTTETTIDSTYFESREPINLSVLQVPIGKPLINSRCYVLDDYLRFVPMGVAGCLYIGGQGISEGYLNDQELTALKFRDDPFGSGKIYETGDFARYLPDGNIEFLERSDDQIKIRGNRIEPKEIELSILQYIGIKKAFVTVKEIDNEKFLCAYVVAENVDILSLRSFLTRKIPRYMVPSHIVSLSSLPLMLNGKVNVRALPIPVRSQSKQNLRAENSIEKVLVQIWNDVLKRKDIGLMDDFFSLGGQSIKALQILAKVNKKFNTAIKLSEFFMNPTLTDLARLIIPQIQIKSRRIASPDGIYDVTSNQRSIFFHTKLSGCESLYNLAEAFKIIGEIDLTVLEEAIDTLVSRHEMLRTSFKIFDGKLKQQIHEQAPKYKIESKDLVFSDNTGHAFTAIKNTEIDLEKWPLFKVIQVRHPTEGVFMVLVIHHIISDAISYEIIIRELSILYNSLKVGLPNPLPDLILQYRDFIETKKEIQKSKPLNESFFSKIRRDLAPFSLTGNFKRESKEDYLADHFVRALDNDLVQNVLRFSSDENFSPFTFWAASLSCVLFFYTKQEKVLISYPSTERDLIDEENIIGYFSNLQLLTLSLNGDQSFDQILAQVKRNLLDNFEWRVYSLEQIAELSSNQIQIPPIEVSLVLNETDSASVLEFNSVIALPYKLRTSYSKYNMLFSINRMKGDWELDIEYNKRHFSSVQIERLASQLIETSRLILRDKKNSIGSMRLFDKWDEKFYQTFNATIEPKYLNHSLAALLAESCDKFDHDPALIFEGKIMTYADLKEKSARAAIYFHHIKKIGKGDIVGVYLDRSEHLVVIIMGLLKLGAVFLPMDPSIPVERVNYMMQDSNAQILVSNQILEACSMYESIHPSTILSQPVTLSTLTLPGTNADDIVYILYTSGSTGRPKGVKIKSEGLANYLLWFNQFYLSGNRNFHTCLFSSIGFDLTMSSLFSPLLRGDSIHIFPEENSMTILRTIFSGVNRINTLKITPSHIRLISTTCDKNYALKKIIVGGEKLTRSLVSILREKAPLCEIYNEYGPTETTIGCSVMKVVNVDQSELIGVPIANTQIYIVDENKVPLPIGIKGEIAIAGIGLADGYSQNKELTERKFTSLNSDPPKKVYLTGDVGKLNFNGFLEYFGRRDGQVKIDGVRIEPQEVEKALLDQHYISEALVVAKEIAEEKFLVAYLQLTQAVSVSIIKEALIKKLPAYLIPLHFISMQSFPLNVNGKISMDELPFGEEFFMRSEVAKPRNLTSLEALLLGQWRDALSNQVIDINSNFFNEGGNSFKVIKLFNAVQKHFPSLVDISDIYSYPTVSAMTEYIRTKLNLEQKEAPQDEFLI